jgi:cyclopropane fatty-acyl-phospholipid synthase-like methyltransferase
VPTPPTTPLPPPHLRPADLADASDNDFLAAAMRRAQVLRRRAGMSPRTRLMDWGCGAGQLAIGIRHLMGGVAEYHGVDARPEFLDWAQEHLADDRHCFTLVEPGSVTYDLPADPGSVDLLVTGDAFTQLVTADVTGWATSIAALLAPRARVVMSAWVAQGVPDSEEREGRPDDVTYERGFFESTLYAAGLTVEEYVHSQETHGPSFYVLAHR